MGETITTAALPATWADATSAVSDGVTSVMSTVTSDTLLTALVFGFLFVRKSIGIVKRLVKLGGKN